MVLSEFMFSMLMLKKPPGCVYAVTQDSLIYHARNNFVKAAIEGDFDYVFMADSDMELPVDALERLLEHNKDIASGFCFKRLPPYNPAVWNVLRIEGDRTVREMMTEWDDGLIRVEGVGMACVLIKTEVFRKLDEYPFMPTKHFGEDLMFCIRAREAGHEIYVDTTLIIPHIGKLKVTDEQYITLMRYNAMKESMKDAVQEQETGKIL
jgi:GT2 family glycosyltransferase